MRRAALQYQNEAFQFSLVDWATAEAFLVKYSFALSFFRGSAPAKRQMFIRQMFSVTQQSYNNVGISLFVCNLMYCINTA